MVEKSLRKLLDLKRDKIAASQEFKNGWDAAVLLLWPSISAHLTNKRSLVSGSVILKLVKKLKWGMDDGKHDPKCDIEPFTLTWKRNILKGHIAYICSDCRQKVEK